MEFEAATTTSTATSGQEERKLRWGILGSSFISDIMISAIQQSTFGEVYCVGGRTEKSVTDLSDKYNVGVRYFTYDELLNDPMVDVVYIGLPTYLHAEYMIKCIEAKKHILCEKSFTLNSKETREVIAKLSLPSSSNIFCLEAQMYRFHPIIPELKETINRQPFGRILSVEATFTAQIVDLFNRTAGGSILDLGCYPISITRYLFGEPLSVTGSSTIISPDEPEHNNYDVDSTAHLILPNDITATVIARNNEDLKWEFIVRCENGTIELTNLWNKSPEQAIILTSAISNELSSRIIRTSNKNFYTLQIDAVNGAIQAGKREVDPPGMTWEDSLGNMLALDAWRDAIGLKYPQDK